MRTVDNAQEWFWCHVTKTTTCWLWTGRSVNAYGYGQILWQGRNSRANRVAWELTYGPIPEGMHVLHSCDNPPCVRPNHLHLGSHSVNMKEASERGRFHSPRADWEACPQGHPFDEANTYIDPRGWRRCKACAHEAVRRMRAKRKQAV